YERRKAFVMHDLGHDSSEYRALAGLENKKGQHTLAWIAKAAGLKLFCAFPRPLERFAFPDLALDHARSRLDDGGWRLPRRQISPEKSLARHLYFSSGLS